MNQDRQGEQRKTEGDILDTVDGDVGAPWSGINNRRHVDSNVQYRSSCWACFARIRKVVEIFNQMSSTLSMALQVVGGKTR